MYRILGHQNTAASLQCNLFENACRATGVSTHLNSQNNKVCIFLGTIGSIHEKHREKESDCWGKLIMFKSLNSNVSNRVDISVLVGLVWATSLTLRWFFAGRHRFAQTKHAYLVCDTSNEVTLPCCSQRQRCCSNWFRSLSRDCERPVCIRWSCMWFSFGWGRGLVNCGMFATPILSLNADADRAFSSLVRVHTYIRISFCNSTDDCIHSRASLAASKITKCGADGHFMTLSSPFVFASRWTSRHVRATLRYDPPSRACQWRTL